MNSEDHHSEDEPEKVELIDDPIDMPDRRLWLWVGLVVVLLVAGGIGAPYAYRYAKVWRAHRFIQEAKDSFGTLNVTNGVARLHSAVVLAPDDPEVLRLAAETLALFRSSDCIRYWDRLEQKGLLTPFDRLNRARAALFHVRLEIAGRDLETLYRSTPTDTNVLGLSIDFFSRIGNRAKAREAAAELLRVEPNSRSGRLAAGGLLASDSANPSNRIHGRQLLMELATSTGPFQTNAWQLLETLPDLTASDCGRLVAAITNQPLPTLVNTLAAAEFSRRADSNSVAAWIPKILEAARGKTESAAFPAACVWLMDRGQFQSAVDLIPESEANRSAQLTALRIQALSLLKQFPAVEAAINDPNIPLTPFDRALFRGALADQSGRAKDVDGHWTEAQNLATNRAQIRQLAIAASGAGRWRIAATSWQRLIPISNERFEPSLGFLQNARRTGDTRLLLEAHKKFLDVVPGDIGVRTEAAYLQLVLGDHPDDVLTEINAFPAQMKASDRIQFLIAFVQLRTGKMNEGLATLERLSVDWATLEDRWKALYASLLAANGQREAARRFSSSVKVSTMTSAERECFGTWLPTLH